MIPSQREVLIKNLLTQHSVVTIDEICTHCNCSPETARRDLRRLEDRGLLIRTHGGAVHAASSTQSSTKLNGSGILEARGALIDRADVLIVSPSETAATRLLVERARRAGVPIISESTNYPGATTLVSIDDYQAGLELGRWVAGYARQHLDGKIVLLDVSLSLPNTAARSRGFTDGLGELPAAVRTTFRVNGQGMRETAYQIAADALAVHPDINVIFGINDHSALGALDAYHAARLDENHLLVVSFGVEGNATKDLLQQGGPYKAGVAMFPEMVGRACIDVAICAYHGCPLPERLSPPFTIVTSETLENFYRRDDQTGQWLINWMRAEQIPNASTHFAMLGQCHHRGKPARIGYVQIYASHEWYQIIRRSMRVHTQELGIALEIVDASQDIAQEIHALKQAIGYMAARFVREGDTIIIDAGVTTSYLAQALRGRQRLTVITNSLAVLAELEEEKDINLVSSGGVVRHESRSLVGPGAEATFRELRADKAFIATTGLSLNFGLSNTNIAEATVKQAMIGAAREVILLADYTKIGVESLVKIASIDNVDKLITDAGISAHDRLALTQGGIDVIIAED